MKTWDQLPDFMRIPEVRPYWEILYRQRGRLVLKRLFDLALALILVIPLLIPMAIIAAAIKLDSKGPALFCQERVTAYGKRFRIHKFRTMAPDAEQTGSAVTVGDDVRITKFGAKLRRYRLDELPQLIDVIRGDMSFVGTRPEVVRYVDSYRPEYYATLLLPAGITSEASIRYLDEDRLLSASDDVDKIYLDVILPEKMKINLYSLHHFSLTGDMMTMLRTVKTILGKEL